MNTANSITEAIVEQTSGLLKFSAELSIRQNRQGTFLNHLYNQLTQHTEQEQLSARRMLGDEISDAILKFFEPKSCKQ